MKLPVYEKVPRHKKFDGRWYIITDINFTKKYAMQSFKTTKKLYGGARTLKYKHKSGAIEYAIYGRNPKGKYGKPPKGRK
jgi:hypothetical protein